MDEIHKKIWAWSAKSNRSTGKADADAELAFAIRVSKVHSNGYSGCRDEESIIPVATLSTLRQAQDLELSQSLKSEKFKTSNRFHPEDLPKKRGSPYLPIYHHPPVCINQANGKSLNSHHVSSMAPWALLPDPPTESFLPAEWRTRSDQKRIQFQHGQ